MGFGRRGAPGQQQAAGMIRGPMATGSLTAGRIILTPFLLYDYDPIDVVRTRQELACAGNGLVGFYKAYPNYAGVIEKIGESIDIIASGVGNHDSEVKTRIPGDPFLVPYVNRLLDTDPLLDLHTEHFWEMQEAAGTDHLDDAVAGLTITNKKGTPTQGVTGPGDALAAQFFGNGAVGDGSGFYEQSDLITETQDFTIIFFIRRTNGPAIISVLYTNQNAANNGYPIIMRPSGKFFVSCNAGDQADSVNPVPIDGEYHMVVVQNDGGQWRYYFDGALDTDNAGTGAVTMGATRYISVATNRNEGAFAFSLGGMMSLLSYHSAVLTATDIAELWDLFQAAQVTYREIMLQSGLTYFAYVQDANGNCPIGYTRVLNCPPYAKYYDHGIFELPDSIDFSLLLDCVDPVPNGVGFALNPVT